MKLKNVLSVLTALLLVFALTGCGKTDNSLQQTDHSVSNQRDTEVSSSDITPEDGSDILVVYFSRTGEQYGVGVISKGNTEIVAEMIAKKTGADLYEILP